jgi:hypothetical protein
LEAAKSPKGHPLFRLGALHLLEDNDEQIGLKALELAYHEDRKYAAASGGRAEDRAAYRLLALLKDFLAYLDSKKPTDWERKLLLAENRQTIMSVFFTVYNLSLTHPLDMPGFTVLDFQKLIKNDSLRRFAGENYFCTQELLEMFVLDGQHINKHNNQYPLGRAIVGQIGGVLEAIWLDRLPSQRKRTLGELLREAHEDGVLKPNSNIAALSSLMLFMRNHVHPGVDIQRLNYFIDMNVAKGCKVALDMTIGQLLAPS